MTTIESTIVESVVFKRTDRQPVYLLLQRSASESLYPGMWQIITGRIEAGESAVTAALRELDEETSLRPLHFWAVPMIDSFYDVSHDSVQVCPLFAAEMEPGASPRLSREHQKSDWMEFEAALQYLVWPGHHKALETVHRYIVAGREAARLTEIKLSNVERKNL